MTAPVVTLPRIVGQPTVAAAALVPHRWEPRLAVSFAGVMEITMPALREIVQTGTAVGTRPLHLLDVNDSIRHAVGVFLLDEPIFAPFVLFEALPTEEALAEAAGDPPESEEMFTVQGGEYTREQAAGLRNSLTAWLVMTERGDGTGWPT